MKAIYHGECEDGRVVTAGSKWSTGDLARMSSEQLIEVLAELRDFARYYQSNFAYPIQRLKQENSTLRTRLRKAKRYCLIFGSATAFFTLLWLLFAFAPPFRTTGIAVFFAVLTFCSILGFVPILLHFLTVQAEFEKRAPRITAKLKERQQKQEQEIFDRYGEYLISGYLVSREFSLSENALSYMIDCLSSGKAMTLGEANVLCRKKFGKASFPPLIQRLQGENRERVQPAQTSTGKAPSHHSQCSPVPAEESDYSAVIQAYTVLGQVLRRYAAASVTEPRSCSDSSISEEEQHILQEYRALTDQQQLRLRRILTSFRTGQL